MKKSIKPTELDLVLKLEEAIVIADKLELNSTLKVVIFILGLVLTVVRKM